MSDENERIARFLSEGPWAVVGASADRGKYGNKVLRAYQAAGLSPVYPVNPRGGVIEGLEAFPDLASLPETPKGISIITPPDVTEAVVEEAAELGIERVWLQPGAENERTLVFAEHLELDVIAGGPCILVALSFRE